MEYSSSEDLGNLVSYFPPDMSCQLAEGLASAFALVACSDGKLHPTEPVTFSDLIQRCNAIGSLDKVRIESAFDRRVIALMENFETAKPEALQAVARMCTNKKTIAAAVALARRAAVADLRLHDNEEAILKEIAEAAGIPADTI